MEIKSFKAYNFGNDTVNGQNRAGGVYRFYDGKNYTKTNLC